MTFGSVPRVFATLCLLFSLGGTPALAATTPPANPVKAYANVLRTLNPKLPEWQSRKWAASVLANAARTHVDPRFIMAIVTVESAWHANAVSRTGARGLGQLMPHTARALKVDAWDPAQNLRGTANYLKSLLDRFHGQGNTIVKAIAGYNAGPNAVKKFGGIPPYAETEHYVKKVLRVYQQLNDRVGVAWSPYAHHREFTRRTVEESALSVSAQNDADYVLAPIPAFVPAR